MRNFLSASALFVFILGVVAPSNAQDFTINGKIIDICLQIMPVENRMVCAGKAADACMKENEGGESTVGMSSCLSNELDLWDAKLNKAYSVLLEFEKADDEDAKTYQYSAPEKVPALKEMQRKWIGYRDALCDYEVSQWGGGTGSGPAFMSCIMTETARQYFILQNQIGSRK